MTMTDPIADMLTRIRNGLAAKKRSVEMPSSKIKAEIARILKEEGYILNFKVVDNPVQNRLQVDLKYQEDGRGVIEGIQRVSRPGCREYMNKTQVAPVYNGLGIGILSTSQGLMTDKAARKAGVGGEFVCKVW
ncbi:MAG: 30S ribosomal protein S8 [Acidobacteriota bacterium]|jgi:small subunit ribosomal protein S8